MHSVTINIYSPAAFVDNAKQHISREMAFRLRVFHGRVEGYQLEREGCVPSRWGVIWGIS